MFDQSRTPYPIGDALVRLLLEELPAIVWSTDSGLRFTSCLGAGLPALDLRHDQVVGTTLFEVFGTDDRSFPAIAAHCRALQGESISFEQEWAGNSYQTRVDPLRDETGRIIGCIGVAQGGTERTQMERALHTAQKELDQRVADRTATLAKTNQRLRHEIKERKQTEETIRKEHQYLQYLLELQDRDRQLISCELHDGLVQQLAGAIMRLEAGQLDVGLPILKECMKEARWLIHGLRPPILDEYGVVAAIEELVSQEEDNGKPTVEFSHKIGLGRMPPSLENTIFRIVQESLANARRHSQSMKVRIRVVQREDGIRIEVQDWGVGFNPGKIAEGHFGLEGIKERTRLFRGAFTIRSSPGKGTRILFRGAFTIRSSPGKGTRIVVQLPLLTSSLCPIVSPQSVLH